MPNNQNITGGSSLTASGAGTGGKLSDPSVAADTGVRATSVLNTISGMLTSGGSDAPTDVAHPFDTMPEGASGVLDTVVTTAQNALNPGGGSLIPGGAVQGAGIFTLLTGRNLMIVGGLAVAAYLVWKYLLKSKSKE